MPGLLTIEPRGAVALVTLQRPDKRNALSIDLRVELADAFTHLAGDDSVACIVLTGAGTAFCSGMDTGQFGGDPEHRRRLVETSTGAFHAVGRTLHVDHGEVVAPEEPAQPRPRVAVSLRGVRGDVARIQAHVARSVDHDQALRLGRRAG